MTCVKIGKIGVVSGVISSSDVIGVGRIRKFPFSSDSAYLSVAYDPVKIRSSELEAEAEEPTNHSACSYALRLQLQNKDPFDFSVLGLKKAF